MSNTNHQLIEPAAQLMAIEVVSELLVSTSPHKLGETLTEQLRELTGARTVMVLVHCPEPHPNKPLYVSPQRRSTLFTTTELTLFCQEKTPGELPLLPEDLAADHPLRAPLLKAGVHSMARYPLRVGGELVAQLLLFDLPAVERIAETSHIIHLLAAPIALALKNALAFRLIEEQARELERRVEERTAELRQSEQRQRSIFKTAMDGIWLTDKHGRFVDVNETYCQMSGYSMQELLTMSIADVEHLEAAGDVAARIVKIMEQGEDRFESQHRRKDNTVYDVEISIQYRSADDGQLVAFLRDITERKQAENRLKQQKTQLEQRNKALRQFNYAVSHELKTPLVSIESSLGLIQDILPQAMDPELSRVFGYARTATRQMNNLLESLLMIFRIDTADSGTETTAFRVLVQDAVDRLTRANKLEGIKVTIAEEGPELCGDRHKLVQVWLHLIGNAAKYMGDQKNPAIDIGIEQTGQKVLFYVRDNGIGIEQVYQDKIFGLFDQLDKTAEGTGLGLTLVQRIVGYYGGTIRVESDGARQGSCFYFMLPDVLINKDTPT